MSIVSSKENKKLELKKHVNAIHCSNNLTLVQRKLFNALLFNAYSELPYKQKFEIKGKDLYKLIGYNSKDSGKLKDALLGLITISIEWNIIDSSSSQVKGWKASSILASAELTGGICVYEYSQVMKDFLYRPEVYGRVNIELVSKFKSGYGLALYENCVRYKDLAQTPWFPLEMFRKLMGVFENKYMAFKDFKKRVIDIAVNEVNSISPIMVTPEIERINQKVVKIRFKFSKNIKANSAIAVDIKLDQELKIMLTNIFSLSQQMIEEILVKYEETYVREKVDIIIKSDSFTSGKIRGLAGYLVEALKKDYKHNKSSKVVLNESIKARQTAEEEQKSRQENRLQRYNFYVCKRIASYIAELTEEQNQNLLDNFKSYMGSQNVFLQRWYKQHGLEHPAIKGCFNNFIKEDKSQKLGDLLSLEDFISLIDESN